MNDRVVIEGLTVLARIGVYDWEQAIEQRLVLDVEMAWDCQRAAQTDNVQFCLNYAEVSQFITDYIRKRAFKLIERLAYELCDELQAQFSISALRIKVSKPTAVANAQNVAVIVSRGQL
ncbi:dihydroneopterin aldolase [Pasteurellaceae bacterium HPA106]|uniref:dihydroneopterin aldolase n=1 Tax=Spirabiliibacterium pneumoniae TaxID=221400 RepID=UPI001AACEB37|nr:dihydroneopterin aldolase [Spirabiliibacterium pneumoniae]MBE2895766.1 dihydroneopterin aldolase [Spirabiliibacterium pneumoniae]